MLIFYCFSWAKCYSTAPSSPHTFYFCIIFCRFLFFTSTWVKYLAFVAFQYLTMPYLKVEERPVCSNFRGKSSCFSLAPCVILCLLSLALKPSRWYHSSWNPKALSPFGRSPSPGTVDDFLFRGGGPAGGHALLPAPSVPLGLTTRLVRAPIWEHQPESTSAQPSVCHAAFEALT